MTTKTASNPIGCDLQNASIFGIATQFRLGAIALVLAVTFGLSSVRAGVIGDYSILTTNPNADIHLNGPGITFGDVGIASSGKLSLDGSTSLPPPDGRAASIDGRLFLGNTATVTHPNLVVSPNPNSMVSPIFMNQDAKLNNSIADVNNLATFFAGLPTTQSVPGGSITSATTLFGMSGLNVLSLSDINLGGGQALTLNGPADAIFVIKVSDQMVLNSGQVNLTGGLQNLNVVFDLTGTGTTFRTSGGLNQESVVNGVIFTQFGDIAMAPGKINGELISGGKSIQLASGSSVVQPPPEIVLLPEPGSAMLLFSAGAVFLLKRSKIRRLAV